MEEIVKQFVRLIAMVLQRFGFKVAPMTKKELAANKIVPIEEDKCSVNEVTIEVTLGTAQSYLLNQYQRLNGTLLKQITVPFSSALTLSSTNLQIALVAAYENAYLTLMNTRSEKIVDKVPLLKYMLDDNFLPKKGLFNEEDIDWTTSSIYYPDAAIPTASTGRVVQIIVTYQDIPKPGYH